jgi:hypothetical protein
MTAHRKLLQTLDVEILAVALDTNGAVIASDWLNMKGASRMLILISQGAWAAGTPAVTIVQAVTNGGVSKAVSFTEKYSKVALSGSKFVRAAVTSDTFNLPNVANTITVIEMNAGMLDRDNGYAYVQLKIASPGANADLITCYAVLDGLRYQGDAAVILDDPKV